MPALPVILIKRLTISKPPFLKLTPISPTLHLALPSRPINTPLQPINPVSKIPHTSTTTSALHPIPIMIQNPPTPLRKRFLGRDLIIGMHALDVDHVDDG